MKLRFLGLVAMLITSPAYADEAMTVDCRSRHWIKVAERL
jgi:hypothetical protein